MKLTVNPAKADPRFVYYFFRHPDTVQTVKNRAITSGVPHINLGILREFELPLPPLNEQREIVETLANYDALMENNRRRMELLEESARLLYREWFVRLRFPGHEHDRLTNGIPAGWAKKSLESVCTEGDGIQTGPFGSQLHQSDYTEEGVPVVMPTNIIGFRISIEGIARIPEGLADKLGRHRMIPGDTVYGRRGDIGRRAFISRRHAGWFCGTGSLRIRPNPKEINPCYLFDTLGSPETAGTIANRAKGATMPNLNGGVLKSVPVLVAPRSLQDIYAEQVEPMSDLIETLAVQNQKLRAARDLLLPRLMSGEISL
jgi:type I restriction enzyme S subunit